MLWSRQAVPTHRQVAVAGQPGVFVEEVRLSNH